jgi:hypothetical protein
MKPKVMPEDVQRRQLQVARLLSGWRMLVMEKCDELPEETESSMETDGRSAEEAESAQKGHPDVPDGKEG